MFSCSSLNSFFTTVISCFASSTIDVSFSTRSPNFCRLAWVSCKRMRVEVPFLSWGVRNGIGTSEPLLLLTWGRPELGVQETVSFRRIWAQRTEDVGGRRLNAWMTWVDLCVLLSELEGMLVDIALGVDVGSSASTGSSRWTWSSQ